MFNSKNKNKNKKSGEKTKPPKMWVQGEKSPLPQNQTLQQFNYYFLSYFSPTFHPPKSPQLNGF